MPVLLTCWSTRWARARRSRRRPVARLPTARCGLASTGPMQHQGCGQPRRAATGNGDVEPPHVVCLARQSCPGRADCTEIHRMPFDPFWIERPQVMISPRSVSRSRCSKPDTRLGMCDADETGVRPRSRTIAIARRSASMATSLIRQRSRQSSISNPLDARTVGRLAVRNLAPRRAVGGCSHRLIEQYVERPPGSSESAHEPWLRSVWVQADILQTIEQRLENHSRFRARQRCAGTGSRPGNER